MDIGKPCQGWRLAFLLLILSHPTYNIQHPTLVTLSHTCITKGRGFGPHRCGVVMNDLIVLADARTYCWPHMIVETTINYYYCIATS